MSNSERGKFAERKVRDALKAASLAHGVWYMRLPDAHAGSMTPTTADFLMLHKGLATFIEVKEVAHDYRLPHKNFKPDQVARMQAARLAGGHGVVLIYHSTSRIWRQVPLEVFRYRTGGSWDLSQFPTKLLQEITQGLLT